jgi:hypothetical protein
MISARRGVGLTAVRSARRFSSCAARRRSSRRRSLRQRPRREGRVQCRASGERRRAKAACGARHSRALSGVRREGVARGPRGGGRARCGTARGAVRTPEPSFQGSGYARCTVVYALRRCDPRAIARRALRAASRGGGIWWLPWRRHPPQLLPENCERVIDGLCAQRDRLVRPLGRLSVAVLAMFPTSHPMKPAKHDLANTSHACLTRVC